MKARISMGEKYGPAMEVETQEEADAYFAQCVEHCMRAGRRSRKEAEKIERHNLGYFAGYYGNATRERVERLFKCAHPIFGPIRDGVPSADEAFLAGVMMGRGFVVRKGKLKSS